MLNEKKKEDENFNYDQPRMNTYEPFLDEVHIWKLVQVDPQTLNAAHDSIRCSPKDPITKNCTTTHINV